MTSPANTDPRQGEELSALLARVEGAEGPDRVTDKWLASLYGPFGGPRAPAYTASLDAALALVERCLPGADVYVHATTRTKPKAVIWPTEYGNPVDSPPVARPALAVCAALLRALITQPEAKSNG